MFVEHYRELNTDQLPASEQTASNGLRESSFGISYQRASYQSVLLLKYGKEDSSLIKANKILSCHLINHIEPF